MTSDEWLRTVGDVSTVVVATALVSDWVWKKVNVELSRIVWRGLFPSDSEQCDHSSLECLPWPLSPGRRYSMRVSTKGEPSFEGLHGDGKTELPAMDLTQGKVVRSFLFLYEEEMNFDRLREGFQKVLRRFPQVGGTVRSSSCEGRGEEVGGRGVERHWIEHSNPEVEFVVVRHTAHSAPRELQEAELSSVAWQKEPWMPFMAPLPAEWPVECNAPLTRVQVTYFDAEVAHCGLKDVRTAVCLCMSHLVADASAVFHFTKEWSAHCRTPEVKRGEPAHNRMQIARVSFPLKYFSPQKAKALGWRVRNLIPVLWQLVMSQRNAKEEDELRFWFRRFTQREIDALKNHVRKELGGRLRGHYLSANDVVCALMWKLRTEHETLPCTSNALRLVIINNFRAAIGVPDDYFGNALLFAFTEKLSRDMSIAEVAFRVRLMAEEWADRDRVQSSMEYLESTYHRGGMLELATINPCIDYPTTMLVSNWTKFNATDVDFGYGSPLRFVYPMAAPLPGMYAAISYPVIDCIGNEELIYEWHYSGSQRYHDAVSAFSILDIQP